MKNFILGFLLFPLILILFYFGAKDIWYPYYEAYLMPPKLQPLPCPILECNQTRDVTPSLTTEPQFLKMPEPPLNSQQRLKRMLADSDFVLYPKRLTLIGLKHERQLEVWGELLGKWRLIHTYNFTAYSGQLGPKLREGDGQIPEGIYPITYLNPNSKFHLSLRIGYPNSFDKRVARQDKRTNLGSDIMIHGSRVTSGCIPIGNDNIEELYFLAEKVGITNIKVILSPVDFRRRDVEIKDKKHLWLSELYTNISQELKPFISQ